MLAAVAACIAASIARPAISLVVLVGTKRISSACILMSGALALRILLSSTGVSLSPSGPRWMILAPPRFAVRVVPPAKAIACKTVRCPLSIRNPLGLPTSPTT